MEQEQDKNSLLKMRSAGTASRVEIGEQVNNASTHLKLADARGSYIAGESSQVAIAGNVNKNPIQDISTQESKTSLKADLGINEAAAQIGREVRQHALDRGLSPESAAWMETYAKNMALGLGGSNQATENKKDQKKNSLTQKTEEQIDSQALANPVDLEQRNPNAIQIQNPLLRARGQSLAAASQNLNPIAQPQAIAMTTDGQFISAARRDDQALKEADMLRLGVAAGLTIAAAMTPTPEQIAAERKRAEEEQKRQREDQQRAADAQHRQALELKERLAQTEKQLIALQGREISERQAQELLAASIQTERLRAADSEEAKKPKASLENVLLQDRIQRHVLSQTEYGQDNCLGMSLAADRDSLRAQINSKQS